VHVSHGLDSVVETITVLSAVAEDLPGLHPADHMLDPGSDLAMRCIVSFFARQEGPSRAFAVGHDHAAV